jgi:hypothetical protein
MSEWDQFEAEKKGVELGSALAQDACRGSPASRRMNAGTAALNVEADAPLRPRSCKCCAVPGITARLGRREILRGKVTGWNKRRCWRCRRRKRQRCMARPFPVSATPTRVCMLWPVVWSRCLDPAAEARDKDLGARSAGLYHQHCRCHMALSSIDVLGIFGGSNFYPMRCGIIAGFWGCSGSTCLEVCVTGCFQVGSSCQTWFKPGCGVPRREPGSYEQSLLEAFQSGPP